MQTVIKNGTVYQNGRLIHADVLIEDQKIKAIGTDLTGDKVIDATGKLVSQDWLMSMFITAILDKHIRKISKLEVRLQPMAALLQSVRCQM